jgi:hypothetical protein
MKDTVDIHFIRIDDTYFAVSDRCYVQSKHISEELIKTLKFEHWNKFLEL